MSFFLVFVMPRPILATVHLSALSHNLRMARARAGDAQVWAVVKAHAYGHGLARVFPALRGADGFALLDLAEAQCVRDLGWRGPVLLLEGAFEPRDLELCSRLGLWHVVHTDEQIDWLATHKTQEPHRVFLKMNSGMNRLGFRPVAFRAAWTRLNALPQVGEISLMTHFSDADGDRLGHNGIAHQVATFVAATHDLPGERSLCNSAATLRHASYPLAGRHDPLQADWVRAGIMLYGSAPDHPEHTSHHWALQPSMTLSSRLIGIQTLAAGETVGYGSRHTAVGAVRVGMVACGYADGYPRHASLGAGPGAPVLVDGVRTHLVGRVSMDMLTVDLGPVDAALLAQGLPPAQVGSEVVLWGRSARGPVLPIDDVAHASGTIAYELMCALAARVPVQTDDEDDDRTSC
jgi:alanine racemase